MTSENTPLMRSGEASTRKAVSVMSSPVPCLSRASHTVDDPHSLTYVPAYSALDRHSHDGYAVEPAKPIVFSIFRLYGRSDVGSYLSKRVAEFDWRWDDL